MTFCFPFHQRLMRAHVVRTRIVRTRSAQIRVALLALAFTACTSKTDVPGVPNAGALPDGRSASALVQALDSVTLSKLEARTGEWHEADAKSTWRAWVSGGRVRLIDELMSVGDYGARHLQHYYTDEGKLAALVETRDQLVLAGDRPPTREVMHMTIEFSGDSASKTSKVVNSAIKAVEPYEIESAKKHAALLLSAAMSAPTAGAGPVVPPKP